MGKVLFVKNISREGPGTISRLLQSRGISYDVVDLHAGEKFPDATEYAALFVMGGPESANDVTQKMRGELARVREAVAAGVPYFGVCLGMQVLVKAMGGPVVRSPVKEVGWKDGAGKDYEVEFTPEGKKDALLAGLHSPMKVFQLHGETVELAEGMQLLAAGRHCTHQIVKVGEKAYGVQGHFELTQEMLAEWARHDPDLQALDRRVLLDDYAKARAEYENNFRVLVGNFLRIAGLA